MPFAQAPKRNEKSIESRLRETHADLDGKCAFNIAVDLLRRAPNAGAELPFGMAAEWGEAAKLRALSPLDQLLESEKELHALDANAADADDVAKKFAEAADRYAKGRVDTLRT